MKDRAFAFVRDALAAGRPITEMDVQRIMVETFAAEGLISDSAPVVGAQENAGNPHYLPTAAVHRAMELGVSLFDTAPNYGFGGSEIVLGKALGEICAEIPFRKSMRWGVGDVAFGRPVQWLVALSG